MLNIVNIYDQTSQYTQRLTTNNLDQWFTNCVPLPSISNRNDVNSGAICLPCRNHKLTNKMQ